MLELKGEHWVHSPLRRKRDVLVAASLLPVGLPVIASGLLVSRLVDGPEPLFSQERIGKHGEPVTVYKIRTMRNAGDSVPSAGPNDPRAGKIGKLLRRFGLDETPQLYNVLSGSLALFGPRALVSADIEAMQQELPRTLFDQWYEVYESGPGCVSSFSHLSHELDGDVAKSFSARALSDIQDYENTSPLNDLRLAARIAQTAGRIVANS